MAWYRAGTVSVTNGSAVVTGANTDFVSNTQQGEAFLGPDGRNYEVGAVISATQLTLGSVYQGASAGGQGYALMPTSSFARDLALGAAQLLNTFAAVRDGIGQGLIFDGTVVAPGLRFAADQDTGIFRAAPNVLALVSGGVASLHANGANIGIGTSAPVSRLHVNIGGADPCYTTVGNNNGGAMIGVSNIGMPQIMNFAGAGMSFGAYNNGGAQTEYARFDQSGNMLIGITAGTTHTIKKGGNQGDPTLVVFGGAQFFVSSGSPQSSACALAASFNTTTGRSINAGGTINASGADYAEYMTKADGCGTITAGDVCGVDVDGKLTRHWAAAISFVVKSTDPSLVGGDVWAAHMDPKPEAPGPEPIAPGDGPVMPDSDEAEALATWHAEAVAHTALVIAYPGEHAAWVSDQAKYEAALDAWETELETARQCVDRIAFCGQVPVNVTGDFAVGDYIIAVANGSGIRAVAVAEADITFDQYRRRIGKIWAVRDGRAWIDVQHG